MYNFLDSKLLPKISSDSQAMDNYEVTNLISDSYVTRARGFLAYSTIKPPIEIEFELICSINVHYIILWTTVGTQKCTGIEIFAKNNNANFISIAYARFKNNGIVFCNRRIYSVNNPPPNIDKSFYLDFFKSSSFRSFSTANVIKLCILQTEKSVPCLGKIEIWGKPSKMCSSTTVGTINRLMSKTNTIVRPTTAESPAPKCNDFEIPEEFKDMLTFEIMSLPVTLPSGNTIDQSTLEKYTVTEASYGRPPSDPFTGQKFTDTRKPLFNTALKSRIDLFLLKNSQKPETFTLKRTVGRTTSNITNETIKAKSEMQDLKKVKVNDEINTIHAEKYSDPDELLNDAIKRTMNSNNFIRFTINEKDPVNMVKCVACKSSENLYSLPCNHLYCRNCLINISKNLECDICKKSFCKTKIERFHF